jgi:hypothetical protein
MIELITDPQVWILLVTLATIEIVLGIDNLVFISIAVSRLPAERSEFARKFGAKYAFRDGGAAVVAQADDEDAVLRRSSQRFRCGARAGKTRLDAPQRIPQPVTERCSGRAAHDHVGAARAGWRRAARSSHQLWIVLRLATQAPRSRL